MPVTHAFVSAKSDPVDATLIKASNWNANHVNDLSVVAVSSSHSIVDTDEFIAATAGSGADITQTLPTAVGRTGRRFRVKKVDSGTANVIVATTSSQTIDGATTYTLSNRWQFIAVMSDGANWLIIAAN